jgi:glucose/arabinose dehydrogenase
VNRAQLLPAALALLALGAMFALERAHAPRVARAAVDVTRPDPSVVETESERIRVATLTSRLSEPWALAFLPDGDILITERAGRLRRFHNDALTEIEGIPPVDTRTQDGLMDIALHPRFAANQTLYFTYSKNGGERGDTTVLAAAQLEGAKLLGVRDLFVADAWNTNGGNSGSRIAFGGDGTIYWSVGERHEQKPAQDLRTDKGKILRLNDDGSIPRDNPFVERGGARPEIFAYGVRNPQGLFVDPNGTIWEHEHGPRGGDELNIIARGHNYGFPAITFGINYNGTPISNETARSGMDQPVVQWTPSISPSGLTIYSGSRFPSWRGNAFLGALSGAHLRRLVIQDGQVTHQEAIGSRQLTKRIRDVRQGPDGFLYVLTEQGSMLRLEPG